MYYSYSNTDYGSSRQGEVERRCTRTAGSLGVYKTGLMIAGDLSDFLEYDSVNFFLICKSSLPSLLPSLLPSPHPFFFFFLPVSSVGINASELVQKEY